MHPSEHLRTDLAREAIARGEYETPDVIDAAADRMSEVLGDTAHTILLDDPNNPDAGPLPIGPSWGGAGGGVWGGDDVSGGAYADAQQLVAETTRLKLLLGSPEPLLNADAVSLHERQIAAAQNARRLLDRVGAALNMRALRAVGVEASDDPQLTYRPAPADD